MEQKSIWIFCVISLIREQNRTKMSVNKDKIGQNFRFQIIKKKVGSIYPPKLPKIVMLVTKRGNYIMLNSPNNVRLPQPNANIHPLVQVFSFPI